MEHTQDSTAERPLRFGTFGWRRPEWQSAYYPDDLPEDWQLGYYANELNAVLLTAAGWVGHPPAELAAWVDETHADFRFYLLADASVDAAAQLGLAAALGDRFGGLLWPVSPAPDDCLAPMAGLPEGVQAWGDEQGLRVARLEVAGLDLRARRGLLDALAPRLAPSRPAAVILSGDDITPASARELQTVAELMGLA